MESLSQSPLLCARDMGASPKSKGEKSRQLFFCNAFHIKDNIICFRLKNNNDMRKRKINTKNQKKTEGAKSNY